MPAQALARRPECYGLIFDIGMDRCQDTDFYLRKGFRVVAVDANPTVCDEAARFYAAEIAEGRLEIINAAISETGEPLVFYPCHTLSAWSTADRSLRDNWIQHHSAEFGEIIVPGISGADLIERYGAPYFAKVDIEGYDIACLRSFRRANEAPTYISTEVDFHRIRAHLGALTALGYTRFALVSQKEAPTRKPPIPALEGLSIDHTFAHHASGVFGRELFEPWVDAGAMYQRCRRLYWAYRLSGIMRLFQRGPIAHWVHKTRLKLFPTSGDWFDVHATRS